MDLKHQKKLILISARDYAFAYADYASNIYFASIRKRFHHEKKNFIEEIIFKQDKSYMNNIL